MLRRNPRYKLQVPHGLAFLGTLLILAGTIMGLGGSLPSPSAQPEFVTTAQATPGQAEAAGQTAERVESIPQGQVNKNRRFKVNLFLFRR
jgi:hypothetical protein